MNADRTAPRIGFVLERSLGHTTHAANLARVLPESRSIRADLRVVPYDVTGPAARIPVYNSNWTVRAGVLAGQAIRQMEAEEPLAALFIHTQVPAVLAQRWMTRIPTVVSLDATPLQYDELGEHYAHERGSPSVEALKYRANRRCFQRAVHVVAWSEWTKQGVVDGYGVPADRVTVVPPGVTPSLWYRPVTLSTSGLVRILFVGGDLQRKGGDVLLDAFAALRQDLAGVTGAPDVELHLVTGASVAEAPGVHVHHGLVANSPELISLYHRSDIFCLPTRGDCLPMVLSEAGAAGLPLVATNVAGIPEIVRDGETGLVVPVDDVEALTKALRTLLEAPDLRGRLGAAAQQLVTASFDADKNAARLVNLLLEEAVPRGRRGGRGA
jgi:glycosyltransferase involved in cell wall biosynthesis